MTLKNKVLIVCSAAAVWFGAAVMPAAAENTTAHRLTRTLRHPVKHHHRNVMMRRDMR